MIKERYFIFIVIISQLSEIMCVWLIPFGANLLFCYIGYSVAGKLFLSITLFIMTVVIFVFSRDINIVIFFSHQKYLFLIFIKIKILNELNSAFFFFNLKFGNIIILYISNFSWMKKNFSHSSIPIELVLF